MKLRTRDSRTTVLLTNLCGHDNSRINISKSFVACRYTAPTKWRRCRGLVLRLIALRWFCVLSFVNMSISYILCIFSYLCVFVYLYMFMFSYLYMFVCLILFLFTFAI